MTADPGTSRRRQRRGKGLTPGDARPPSSAIPLPQNRLTLLSEEQIERIHQASLSILNRTGVVFDSPEALALFRAAGARVEARRVYPDAGLIESCLARAPSHYTLHARNPANNVIVGGDSCVVMPGGGPPYVRDLDGRRRPGTLADLANFTRLSAMSPAVHVMARKAVEAQDVDPAVRHLACWETLLTMSDKPGQSGFPGGQAEVEDVLEMLAIVMGGQAGLDGRPVTHCSVNANSPLRFDRPMLESLIAFAGFGQPVVVSSFVMAGVTGPATLAGVLAQHNAEVLAGLALAQLVRPETPVVYGTASGNADLRNAAPATGSPESALITSACAQLAHRYRLPCRGGGALTDSPLPDGQSNYERMFTLLAAMLSGVHFLMHGLGILESYLTLSYEQFVIDLELLGMIRGLTRPLAISDETLALDVIDAVGPGGHFLDSPHTLRHARQAHFLPQISVRQPYDGWLQEGGRDVVRRANDRCRQLLAAYRPPPMDPDREGELREFVARRTAQLLSKS